MRGIKIEIKKPEVRIQYGENFSGIDYYMERDWDTFAWKCNTLAWKCRGTCVGSGFGLGGRDMCFEFKTYGGALKFKKLIRSYKRHK